MCFGNLVDYFPSGCGPADVGKTNLHYQFSCLDFFIFCTVLFTVPRGIYFNSFLPPSLLLSSLCHLSVIDLVGVSFDQLKIFQSTSFLREFLVWGPQFINFFSHHHHSLSDIQHLP